MEPDFEHQKWSNKLQVVLLPMVPCCPAKLQDNADTLNLQDLNCFAVWQESINETYTTSSADDTYKVTDRMLATLGGALALHMHRMTTHLPPSACAFVATILRARAVRQSIEGSAACCMPNM